MADLPSLPSVAPGTEAEVGFLALAHTLTSVQRTNRLLDGSRRETSAEHSWHVALCAMVLAPTLAPAVDVGRVVRLLTIHDVVEVEVGDVPIYDQARREAAAVQERAAARELFGELPGGAELLALWEEFEDATSDEARFARALDRVQPMLVHWAGGGHVWRERGVTRATVDGFVATATSFWPAVGALAAAIADDAELLGYLSPAP